MTVQPTQGGANAVASGRLWAGGAATAVVAGLIALVGILLARGVFDVPILAPKGEGTWGDADTAKYAVYCALAALVATGLLHLLLISTPRPLRFFGWIMTLATLAGALAPFAASGSTSSKIATGLINVAVGIAIGMLLSGAARAAMRDRRIER
ncbi:MULTISPECIES: DUF6069 family protein [unclassified Kribbella]|uniref:DUF6069 family protein n=1 Tax=unclassified Kribbella TaxID=2644121 RepID=UPI00301AA51D